MHLSTHTAQALANASVRTRGCPIGLGADLDVTTTVPATEVAYGGDSRTSKDRYDPADIAALLSTPVD
jgi:hypothetical protein